MSDRPAEVNGLGVLVCGHTHQAREGSRERDSVPVEALFAGAATEGERAAADHARSRILGRLREVEVSSPL